MTAQPERPIPLLGEVALTAVQSIEHRLDAGFLGQGVVGLAGTAQQHLGRGSHVIRIQGLLQGERYAEDLEALQNAAAESGELTFAADIVTALDLQNVVIANFAIRETAGRARLASYVLELVESPPLPPPAEVSGFGGLDDFGFGDLGFDTDIMGDLTDLAGDVSGAVDGALDTIAGLEALAGLGDIGLGGELQPLQNAADGISNAGQRFGGAVDALRGLFS
jgi:hypothetical protein